MILKKTSKEFVIKKHISFFDCFNNTIKKATDKEDRLTLYLFSKILKNDSSEEDKDKFFDKLSDLHKEVADLKMNYFSREVIESFLFCEDISLKEISDLLEVGEDTIDEYAYWFCDISQIDTYFKKKTWIETRLKFLKSELSNGNYDDNFILEAIKSLLFKRWALLMGKEFVVWKFGLQRLSVTPGNFLETIAKESFFYYKEISMAEKELEYNQYVKLINSLVKTIKDINSVVSQSSNNDDMITSIQDAINMIIVEEAPSKEIPKLDGEIISNSQIN